MSFLKLKNINTGYSNRQVLFDVTFEMQKGETILLVGSNGSGKSSLLKVIYGLLKPWNKNAVIRFKNEDISNFKPAQLLQKGMVYIPQEKELFEGLTVKENLEISGIKTIEKKKLQNKISEVLERIPNLKELIKLECSRLSGGERKQLCLAMALLNNPEIVIYDEPVAGISPQKQNDVVGHFRKLKKSGISLLLVEHQTKNLISLADKVFNLESGKLFDDTCGFIYSTRGVML